MEIKNFKTNLLIEQILLEKRRLQRGRQARKSLCPKQRLTDATLTLNRALKQDTENAQLKYIEKLSPTSTKHSLLGAHPNLSSPIETVTSIRNPSGCQTRSYKDRAEAFALHLRDVFQRNTNASNVCYKCL